MDAKASCRTERPQCSSSRPLPSLSAIRQEANSFPYEALPFCPSPLRGEGQNGRASSLNYSTLQGHGQVRFNVELAGEIKWRKYQNDSLHQLFFSIIAQHAVQTNLSCSFIFPNISLCSLCCLCLSASSSASLERMAADLSCWTCRNTWQLDSSPAWLYSKGETQPLHKPWFVRCSNGPAHSS